MTKPVRVVIAEDEAIIRLDLKEILEEEGYEVDVAAPTVKTLQFVVHDFVDGFDTYTEKPGHSWPADVAFADVNPSDYVAVVVPGGRAPEYLRNDPDVRRILKHFFDAGAPVAALCHGPLMLAAAAGKADAFASTRLC